MVAPTMEGVQGPRGNTQPWPPGGTTARAVGGKNHITESIDEGPRGGGELGFIQPR